MIQQKEATTYYLLDSHQGLKPDDGWRVRVQREHYKNLQVTPEGLSLAPLPVSPEPLKDAAGTFGGLEQPTGVAVDAEGTIYVSDSKNHRIYKIVRREGLLPGAHFFRIAKGSFENDIFVYVPTANRLECWPRTLRRDPQDLKEVEVICESVWNETQARKAVLSFIKEKEQTEQTDVKKGCCGDEEKEIKEIIQKEWKGDYPVSLPSGVICKTSVEYVPCLGGLGDKPRQFNEPRGLAISPNGDLYVVDSKNHRIQVFALRGLVLKAIWGRQAGAADIKKQQEKQEQGKECLPPKETLHPGQPMQGAGEVEFNEPWDVVVDGKGNVYIADKGNDRLQKYDCRTRKVDVIDGTTLCAHFFQVLYGPKRGERFVFIPARRRLEHWSKDSGEIVQLGEGIFSVADARKLVLKTIGAEGARDILVEWEKEYPKEKELDLPFKKPSHVAIDAAGRLYVVDESDAVKVLDHNGCVLDRVQYTREIAGWFRPTALRIEADGNLLLAGKTGIYRLHPRERGWAYEGCCMTSCGSCTGMAADAGGRLYAVGGQSAGVSEIPLPDGFERSGTYISQYLDSDIDRCQWHRIVIDYGAGIPTGTSVTVWTYTAGDKQTDITVLADNDWQTGQANGRDFLIQSPPGQYLWLKIELKGNGDATPLVRHMKVYFPRNTYLEYLPAVYQADPTSRNFLEQFLSIFEAFFSDIEGRLDTMSRYFDPDGVPEEFLPWLASWVDMAFEQGWSLETRRRLLRHAPELYRKRGTTAGLKWFLKLALDVDVRILEHFQLRRWLFLTSQSTLGGHSQLWGNCIVSRLQLEENSRIGDFALIGTGDPERDPFHVFAHKFSVFVPAALCRAESTERMLRHVIETEKPAHTAYVLNKVEARFRVGIQATIGLDTMVGMYPSLVLNYCSTLGYDTVLSCAPKEQGPVTMRVGNYARVGVTTVVG